MKRSGWMALALVGILLAASLPFVAGGPLARFTSLILSPSALEDHHAPPTIRLDSPSSGDGVATSVSLVGEARAAAGNAVSDIELRVDGGRWASLPDAPRGAAVAPFLVDIDLDAGDHLLEVRAWDGDAFSLPARALVRAAPSPPPTVSIATPSDGAGVPPGATVVTGTLRNGPARVVVEAAGSTVEATVEGSVWRASLSLPPGVVAITAQALAAQESLPATVTVAAGGPSLAVAHPQDGDAFGSTGDPACPDTCIAFSGAASPDAALVQAVLDGGAPVNVTPAVGAWGWRLPMDSLVSGAHRVSFTPLSSDGAPGVAREVRFLARTPREISIVGDEAPRLTGTPLRFSLPSNATGRWSLDGVAAGDGPSVDVILARPGPHALTVATQDSRGRPAALEVALLALNRPPAATVSAVAGLAVADTPFTANATDEDGAVVRYAWDFGDGATATTEEPVVSHRYASEGVYRANLTVFDDQGAPSPVATTLVAIANAPPVAGFTWAPSPPTLFDAVQFSDASRDPEGRIVSRLWDFGDGTTSDAPTPAHRFATRGDHVVTLRVTDEPGAVGVARQVVTVADLPPEPAFAWEPLSPRAGEPVSFTDLSRKPDGEIANWSWSFGAYGPLATHAFPAPGAFNVTLNVTDDMGLKASVTRQIHVGDAAPEVRAILADPARPLALQPVTFRALANDAMGSIASLRWDFGDGNASDALSPTHAFARSGRHDVSVVATSPANATAAANVTLLVSDAPPVADLLVAGGFAGQPVPLDGSASRDPDGHLARWVFDADGDGLPDCSGDAPRCVFAYPTAGLYLANLTVVDDEGATASVERTIAILPAPADLAPPLVQVTRPASGEALAGQVVVEGTASGNRNVQAVEVQLRSGLRALALGPAPWMPAQGNASWRLALDTAAFPDGSYLLVARATDETGAQGYAFVPVTIRNGEQGTSLALRIANAPLGPVGASYDLEGSAYHPLGVTSVRWRLDDGPWRDPDGPPIAFTVPLRGLDPGLHVVLVDAYRGVSEKREARVEVRVASPPPALVVDEPPGPLAYGLLHARGRALGNGSVQWRLDAGVWTDVDAAGPEWRLDQATAAYPAGRHVLSLRAIGPDGAASEARAWNVTIVRAAGDARFAGWGQDVDGQPPAPEKRAPLDLLAPLLALGLAAGVVRRRL